MSERIRNQSLKSKVMSAEEAVQFINNGDMIGTSGFTGAGYPKGMPAAIAAKANEAHARGDEWAVKILTGASTAPENDGVLAEADAVSFRSPFNTDPKMRAKINEGKVKYTDIHLSELGMYVQEGFFGHMDVAIIEAV
ncbi:MAG: propionyl-CoA--succinate CoA transferase, partial [Corynebacterium variabile]|nr:propionyl-CoA--succinate CoA transferase [Corynebacterium variabile]